VCQLFSRYVSTQLICAHRFLRHICTYKWPKKCSRELDKKFIHFLLVGLHKRKFFSAFIIHHSYIIYKIILRTYGWFGLYTLNFLIHLFGFTFFCVQTSTDYRSFRQSFFFVGVYDETSRIIFYSIEEERGSVKKEKNDQNFWFDGYPFLLGEF